MLSKIHSQKIVKNRSKQNILSVKNKNNCVKKNNRLKNKITNRIRTREKQFEKNFNKNTNNRKNTDEVSVSCVVTNIQDINKEESNKKMFITHSPNKFNK